MKALHAMPKFVSAGSVLAGLSLALITATSHAQSAPTPNVEAAAKKVAMCTGCHNIPGYQATFPELHKVPKIGGQCAQYIASALTAYRKGERKHPTMRSISAALSDQDIADISAYYEQQGGKVSAPTQAPAAPPAVAELLTKGACASCHGANFSTPLPGYPKIAGQHADYLYVALKAYQVENNANIGRGNAIMNAQAKLFTREQLREIANYIGSLPGEVQTVEAARFRK